MHLVCTLLIFLVFAIILVFLVFSLSCPRGFQGSAKIDDRQITRLICVRLRHLLYDFFRGVFGPLLYKKQQEGGPRYPQSHIENGLGGRRLDE